MSYKKLCNLIRKLKSPSVFYKSRLLAAFSVFMFLLLGGLCAEIFYIIKQTRTEVNNIGHSSPDVIIALFQHQMDWLLVQITTIISSTVLIFSLIAGTLVYRLMSQKMLLAEYAYQDQLTQLPNRRQGYDCLKSALVNAQKKLNDAHGAVALLFVDLDNFKRINDTYGHNVGDVVLAEASQRLKHCVRSSDTIFRLGGDEFVVIIEDSASKEEVSKLCQRIVDILSQPISLDSCSCSLSASIGVSFFPTDGDTIDILLQKADVAMYKVKERGKNGYSFSN